MRAKSLIGFAVGPVGSALLGMITVPAVAWMFSPEDVGRLNIFQVTVSFALLLSVLGLDQAYVREFHESKARPRLLLTCFTPGFILMLAVCSLSVALAPRLASALYGVADPRAIFLTVLAFIATYFCRFLSLVLRMQERGWVYSASQVLPKLLSLLLIFCVPFFRISPDFKVLQGIVISGLFAVALVFSWNTRQEWKVAFRERIRGAELRRLLAFGFPLIFSGLAYWGLTATSTFALRRWSALDELAIYSVTNSFAGAAVLLQSIFATIWAPTVYRWVAEGVDLRRVDTVARFATLVACLVVVFVGAMSWVITYLLPSHYSGAKYLIACAVAPSLLYTLSEITTVGVGISRRTIWTIWITMAALFVNIGLSFVLVPKNGAAGAVLANAIAFFVFFAFRTETSAALWRQFPRRRIYAMVGLMVGIACTIVIVRDSLPYWYPLLWLAPLAIVVFACREEIYAGITYFRGRFFRVD